MTINRFRAAAMTLIGFNLVGTFLTLGFHLWKAGTGWTHAIGQGTWFTGPLVLMAIGTIALALTYSGRKRLGVVGVFLLGLWGFGFAIGEISEFFQKRVGVSPAKWDVVLIGSAIGLVIGGATAVTAVRVLTSRRRQGAQVTATPGVATTTRGYEGSSGARNLPV